jgi:SAM-dependent methyltransferase
MAAGARFDVARIQRYYDRHTSAFLRFGHGGTVGAMHRAVWGPGVASRMQALRYVEDQVARLAERLPSSEGRLHIVDLGCGVAESLCYLAAKLPISGTGLTVSLAQVAIAERRIRAAGLSGRVAVRQGDYGDIPPDVGAADVALAIESFAHAPDAAGFFAQCAALVRQGGALVICDDFRRPGAGRAADRTVDRFCRGWCVNTLIDAPQLGALADGAGFLHESTIDLTPYLELGRVRDRAIGVGAAAIGWWPWLWDRLGPWTGGSALQTCLRRGWVGYDLVVFRRR